MTTGKVARKIRKLRKAEFARDFQEEINPQAAAQSQSRAQDQAQLEAVRRKIASMIRAIEDGLYQPSMKARMAELETEQAALEQRLTAREPPRVRLHPNLAGVYREKVAALAQALANPSIKVEAAEVVRGQIKRIMLTPNAEGNLDTHLYGDLARILQFCEMGGAKQQRPGTNVPGRGLSVVSGARSHLCRTCMSYAAAEGASAEIGDVKGGLCGRLLHRQVVMRAAPRRHLVLVTPAAGGAADEDRRIDRSWRRRFLRLRSWPLPWRPIAA